MNTGTSSASNFNLFEECPIVIGGKARGPDDKDFEWFGGRIVSMSSEAIAFHSRRTGKVEVMPIAHIREHKLDVERVGI